MTSRAVRLSTLRRINEVNRQLEAIAIRLDGVDDGRHSWEAVRLSAEVSRLGEAILAGERGDAVGSGALDAHA